MNQETDLELVRRLLARDDIRSDEFVKAATRWETELASGKYAKLTERQLTWARREADKCEANDIGVPPDGYDDNEDACDQSFIDPDIGDR